MTDLVQYSTNLRLQAVQGGPLRGGEEYQFGFYDAGILREVIETYGGGYQVFTTPIPETENEFNHVQQLLSDPELQYALVDKNKIVYVKVENSPGWLTAINGLGYNVLSGEKTNKRLKSLHRPTLLNARFDKDELNIIFVDDDAYSRYNFGENPDVAERFCDPKIIERLLDGGFVISRRMIQKAVKNLPVFEPQNSTDNNDYYYDPRIREHLVHELLNARIVNARIIFDKGFLKGNAIVMDLPEGVDILTSYSNVKREITYDRGFRFLAEPQGPKTRVVTDDQTVINFPQLFPDSDMDMWLTEEYKKMFAKATSGELLTNWKSIYQRMWRDNEDINDNEARARMAYVGYRWTAAGFSVTNSPWLFETVSTSHAAPLKNRIPIPCAVYEQIVPESLVRMAGFDIEVETETIMRINELGVHVVNDIDWLEMYESHGGHDQDDFFKLFYRTMDGGMYDEEKVVIAVRSPNGYGEYSIFRYVEGQWSPKWHMADGTQITFPHVNGEDWPQRLSDAIFENHVSYTGLPSTRKSKVVPVGEYTTGDVIRDVNIAMAGGNVGGYVNATMLHSMVLAHHRPEQLCSLETAIDKCINPDDADDVRAIDNEAKTMVNEVILSNCPVDELFWTKRGLRRFLKMNQKVQFSPGKISKIAELCFKHHKKYVKDIRAWSQSNARPPEAVHEIGQRMYYRALPHLRNFRMKLYNANSSDSAMAAGGIERNLWEQLYAEIVELILSYERYQDQYDFVLGLYSAAIKNPTSGGKVTDQIVMNRFVYPYLEAALQYYGIANISMYDNRSGKVKIVTMKNVEWFWPDADGKLVKYTQPELFQAAHAKDSPVIWNMPKPDSAPLTKSIV